MKKDVSGSKVFSLARYDQPQNWKDRAAGWRRWEVKYCCRKCGQLRVEYCLGTIKDMLEYCSSGGLCVKHEKEAVILGLER